MDFIIDDKELEEHFLHMAMSTLPLRELEVAKIQREKKYCLNIDDHAVITYCNTSEHGRSFSRVVLNNTLHNRWTSFLDITTKLECSDKTTRNIFSKYRQHKMLMTQNHGNRVVFKANDKMLGLYKRYAKEIFSSESKVLVVFLESILQYLKHAKPSNDYQVKDKNSVMATN